MHHLEDVFVLEGDVQVHVFAQAAELFVQLVDVGGGVGDIAGHRHHKVFFHDPLTDVDNVDIGLGNQGADPGDDAHLIDSGNGDNTNLPGLFLSHIQIPLKRLS